MKVRRRTAVRLHAAPLLRRVRLGGLVERLEVRRPLVGRRSRAERQRRLFGGARLLRLQVRLQRVHLHAQQLRLALRLLRSSGESLCFGAGAARGDRRRLPPGALVVRHSVGGLHQLLQGCEGAQRRRSAGGVRAVCGSLRATQPREGWLSHAPWSSSISRRSGVKHASLWRGVSMREARTVASEALTASWLHQPHAGGSPAARETAARVAERCAPSSSAFERDARFFANGESPNHRTHRSGLG